MDEDSPVSAMVHDARALIVEDDPQILDLSKQILQFFGFEVHALLDGKEALDWFQGHADDLDLVVLDRRLSSIGGGALFRVMHQINHSYRFSSPVATSAPKMNSSSRVREFAALCASQYR